MNAKPTPYGKSVRSLQIMLRAVSKIIPDIPPVIPDGIYGEATMRAVSALQSFARLPVTGVVDLAAWNELVALYYDATTQLLPPQPFHLFLERGQEIRPGEKNLHMYLVTAMLQALQRVIANVPTTQVSDHNTAASTKALAWLQEVAGLPVNGHLDRATWRALIGLYRLAIGDGLPDSP